MKNIKVLLATAFACFLISTNASAQDAIGVRLGGGSVSGAEISYQKGLSETNRLQLDLGFGGSSYYSTIGLTGTYQWMFPLADVDGLAWYIGPGASVGFWSYDNDIIESESGISLYIGGIAGIEYTFSDMPLQLGIDTRPMFNIINNDHNTMNWGGAFTARYLF